MAVLFGIVVIVLLVLILATLLGGEEGFIATAYAGLGCIGGLFAIVIAIILIFVLFALW